MDFNILMLFRPSTTGTMLLTTQVLRTATKWCISAYNEEKYANLLICILHYEMSLNHN